MKKLLTLFLFIFFINKSNGQIFYVDVNPDTCVCVSGWNSASTTWDLNNDGTPDFNINVSSMGNSGGSNSVSIVALTNNSVAGDNIGAFAVNAGDTINTQPSWVSGTVLIEFCGNNGYSGHWQGGQDKYIIVQFYFGSVLYYGWINLHVLVGTAFSQVIVKDYAYSTCPSNCFAEIKKIKHNNFLSIYPNPSNGIIQLAVNNVQLTEVKIYDVNGRVVLMQTIQPTPNPSKEGNSINIDASALPSGIYNVSIISNEGIANKRLVITH